MAQLLIDSDARAPLRLLGVRVTGPLEWEGAGHTQPSAAADGNGPGFFLGETCLVSCFRRTPRVVDCSKRKWWPAQCYGEVGRCGERRTSRVISLGAKTRNGGPQKPVPRLV